MDRTWADVTAEFGSPSVLSGGNNPLYGKAVGYLTEDPRQPMAVFHQWNGSRPGAESWPPEHEQPLLLALRFGGGPFRASVTFTPRCGTGPPSAWRARYRTAPGWCGTRRPRSSSG
ncbi:hypothetical protein [Streptomyces sioyaensis]|uniref:hypothetical protein n=1 Tax=Streptomyces sioyaensis TaxID=67364 RepID=UPI00379F1638